VSRLTRVHEVLARAVDAGVVPGAVAVVARHGEVHIETVGNLAFAGAAAARPMAVDTICRLGSTSKPLVAACAMTLVEDGTLRLDDPVDEFLPELADMTVLADVDGPLDDTVAAERSITLRDLLTFRLGTGMVLGDSATSSIAGALAEIERGEGDELEPPPDEWIRRLGALPLLHQPGECWMYETAANVTVVLVSRATGTSFGAALQQRICEPLGMKDTGFFATGTQLDRLATSYAVDAATGGLVVTDVADGYFTRQPAFESGGGGIVSTPPDFLAFASALGAGGVHGGERVLSRPAVSLMTTDHLLPGQTDRSGFAADYFDEIGWGFGMSVRTRRTQLGPSVGTYGWPGFWGTDWYNDPVEDLTTMLMIQRAHATVTIPLAADFRTAVYQAIDD
jgi:CubicO group peptidase (beta-lactamase class C family)